MDIRTAFLEHEIYMKQPEGYADQRHPDFACNLRKKCVWLEAIGTFLEHQDG